MRDIKLETNFKEWIEKIVSGDIETDNVQIKEFDVYNAGTDNEDIYIKAQCEVLDSEGVPWVITYHTNNGELQGYNVMTLSDSRKYR